jgi:hypothetical protein
MAREEVAERRYSGLEVVPLERKLVRGARENCWVTCGGGDATREGTS